jgi:hypothetical protein
VNFPDTWPEDCPPDDAVDAEGDVFRIVRNDPPNAVDMATHMETGKLPKAPPCLRCGLSVFQELQDVIHQRSLFPKLGNLIARATLTSDHGKSKLTEGRQPTHTTWWAFEGVDRAALFSVIADEE